MRLIHACGFKASEREGFRVVVFLNVFNTIQTLLEALDSLDLQLADPSLRVSSSEYIEMTFCTLKKLTFQPKKGIYWIIYRYPIHRRKSTFP